MFTNVNENDAKASIRVWGEIVAREQGVPTDLVPNMFRSIETMLVALREKKVDAVGIDLIEYESLCAEIRFDPIFAASNAGSYTERYVLLVSRRGPVKAIADLKGRSLRFHENSRNCLAPLWLDTLLVRQGLATADRLAGEIISNTKLSQVVLPVFFRKADALRGHAQQLRDHVRTQPAVGQRTRRARRIPGIGACRFRHPSRLHPRFQR